MLHRVFQYNLALFDIFHRSILKMEKIFQIKYIKEMNLER